MSPTVKKLLSALLAAILATVISFAVKSVVPVAPAVLQPILLAVLVAAAHYVDAMGSADAAVAAAKKVGGPLAAFLLGFAFMHWFTGCSSAQLQSDLNKVEVCAADPRVDACVADAAATNAPEPQTALACVQLCLAEPSARTYRLKPVSP